MYNIDFKVSGQQVSIFVQMNDSLPLLVSKMKGLGPFRKYTTQKLEEKLIKCLKQVIKSSKIQGRIRNKITWLIEKGQAEQNTLNYQRDARIKQNMNNNTFVNLLHESSTNISYFTGNKNQEPKKLRKYIKSPKQNQDQYQNGQQVQKQLIYNYKTSQKQNIQDAGKMSSKIKINSYINSPYNKKSFQYPQNGFANKRQELQKQFLISDKQFSTRNKQLLTNQKQGKSSNSNSKAKTRINSNSYAGVQQNSSSYQQFKKDKSSSNNLKTLACKKQQSYSDVYARNSSRQTYNYGIQTYNLDRQIQRQTNQSRIHGNNPYNNVTRLNQPFQKSRSPSRIVQENFSSDPEYKYKRSGINLGQRGVSVGRIHHRQNYPNEVQTDINHKQNHRNYKQNKSKYCYL